MKPISTIPLYAPDGVSLGFRTPDAAQRLLAAGQVTPSYGRKGHLKAIWLRQEDKGNAIAARVTPGTRFSFLQNLGNGNRCWTLRRLESLKERSD